MKKLKLGILVLFLVQFSCNKKDDPFAIPQTVKAEQNAGVIVQDFMWKAMNYWYFWQEDVTDLGDDRFPISTEGTKDYTEFLLSEEEPDGFFNNKLKFDEDRFSFLSDDYTTLTNSLAGITNSNGLKFGLIRFSGSEEIFGVVRYIVAGSDASNNEISRGDIFTGVNGQTLTSDNYRDLLFGDATSYTLNMASIEGDEVTPNDLTVTLTKTEGLAENPIFLDKIFEIEGKKIGYVVYNGFTNEYDEELNAVFGRFKTGGVTELVLDMRYNPGGDVNTSALLSSMIYGTNTNDVFLKARYNDKYQNVLEKNDIETRRFFLDKTQKGTAVNTINLAKVYILTTNGSASASELVINGLAPYVDVVQIGSTTRGKNEFSITMVDDRENRYVFNRERTNQIKSGNSWAIQPLIGRNENADGFSEYTAGLVPDFELDEDLANLGILGDQNEPYLAKAIELITGAPSGKRNFQPQIPMKIFVGSEMFTPLKDNMFVTEVPFIEGY